MAVVMEEMLKRTPAADLETGYEWVFLHVQSTRASTSTGKPYKRMHVRFTQK
jgi:hypothetical protein